jgi:hypothetical protein
MFNTISCTPKQAALALRACYELGQPAYLVGPPGIGKSELVEQFAKSIGAIMPPPLVLSTLQPADIRGVGIPDKDERLKFLPPKFFPPTDSQERYVLFYDELGNADPSLQAPVQQLFLRRECGDYRLPDGAYQVAAGNDVEDGCNVYELSRALVQRLTVIRVRPDAESWLEWAMQNDVHPGVMAFLRTRPEYIHYTVLQQTRNEASDDPLGPTPRSWKVVSDVLKRVSDPEVREILVAGKIGQQACAVFFSVLRELEGLPEPQEILARVKRGQLKQAAAMVPGHLAALWGLAYSLYGYANQPEHYELCVLLFDYLYKNLNDGRPVGEVYTLFMEQLLGKVMANGHTQQFLASRVYREIYKDRVQELTRATRG